VSLEELSTSWHSYPKIYNVGHSYLNDFFTEPVLVEEKVDGSQFSFGIFNGEIKARSKGVQLVIDAPEKMFSRAVETVKELAPSLKDGWTYRAEYLQTPKHNTLAYDRNPKGCLIIFDINPGHEQYLSYDEKKAEAMRLGLECVPKLYEGLLQSAEEFNRLLETISVLGGQKIEGVVCKNYSKMGPDKKCLMAKYVCESFKELNHKSWKEQNPKQGDIIQILAGKYKTPARWNKAIQHLKEKGQLTDSPKDIGAVVKEAQQDLREECAQDIMQDLFNWAYPQLSRICSNGLPEYYKQYLVSKQFDGESK
jgi:hypothetical protein